MRSPYPTPFIGAASLRVCVDELYEDECYLWYTLRPHPHDWWWRWPDLELVRCGTDAFGEEPDWFNNELDGGDFEHDLTYGLFARPRMLTWAMREGLMPEQRFVIYASAPRWHRTSWEYEEWDFEHEVEVVRRLPPTLTMRELEFSIDHILSATHEADRRNDARERARWSCDRRLGVSFGVYTMPSGRYATRASLVSTLHDPDEPEEYMFNTLAKGYGRGLGDESEALSDLARVIEPRRPDLTLDVLKNMPKRYENR